MAKIEFPKWVYPDAPETTRGKIVHNDREEAAYRAECAVQVPVINGDTSRDPDDLGGGNSDSDVETVESVRAKLNAAGIRYHRLAGLAKLQSLLPKA